MRHLTLFNSRGNCRPHPAPPHGRARQRHGFRANILTTLQPRRLELNPSSTVRLKERGRPAHLPKNRERTAPHGPYPPDSISKKLSRAPKPTRHTTGALHRPGNAIDQAPSFLLLERGGFLCRQGSGSHVIYHKAEVEEIINLQPIGSKAKAYQVKQVRNLILKYQLDID